MTEQAERAVGAPNPGRATGLIIFGIVQVLVGIACGVLLLGVAAGSELARHQDAEAGATLASSLVAYGIFTVYFISTGIGSMRRRRWARALALVVSAVWLAAGIVATLVIAIAVPVLAPGASLAAILGGAALAMIVLPGALVFFYRREAVRLTCERSDGPRWTDRVPLPVLAVALTLGFGSVIMLANLSNPVLSIFGSDVSGAPAAVALLALAMLCAFLAVQLYQLKESAWWTLVLMQVLGGLAGIASLFGPNERMNEPGDPLHHNPFLTVLIIAAWIGYLGFLFFLKRYFRLAPRTRRSDVPAALSVT